MSEERWSPDRWQGIATPFLAVDLPTLRRNLARAQALCDDRGLRLRPHVKTHKIPEIARLQVAAGARGLTLATVGEAECFAKAGFDDLFVAYPVLATDDLADRLRRLLDAATVILGVDSRDGIDALVRHGLADHPRLSVLVEVECGLRRTGVVPEEAGLLAAHATERGLRVGGVFTFPGQGYALGAGAPAAADEASALSRAADAFAAEGLPCEIRSGGATPSYEATDVEVVTETRPGVYAFQDAQQVALGTAGPDEVALAVITTVVSAPAPDRLVLDAGSKTLAADRPPYVNGHGVLLGVPGARIDRIWEHHGVVDVSGADPADVPAVGDRVAVLPNHVCTAINLADRVHVRDDGEVATWTVAARGQNG
ncbi:alanine racemase [Mumia sp. ZJ1417]|uniref:alanine racemase n=1 Tax=Mumia sp. ZJ1417 TaxID=2708082 RepID=UPI0014205B0B|nr:alanine racemase [Mumia sp. ZJ1417]QMW66379.1 alanine racemase [Mumia sp. ZJ1417]